MFFFTLIDLLRSIKAALVDWKFGSENPWFKTPDFTLDSGVAGELAALETRMRTWPMFQAETRPPCFRA